MNCPKCHSHSVRIVRTTHRKRDETTVRERVCLACGHVYADAVRLRACVRGVAVSFQRRTK